MFCRKCGGQMPDYAQFCGYCGADMQEGQLAPEKQTPQSVTDTEDQTLPKAASEEHPPVTPLGYDNVPPQPEPETQEVVIPTTDEAEEYSAQSENDTPQMQAVPEPQMVQTPAGYTEAPPMQQAASRAAKPPKNRNKAAMAVWIVSGVLLLAAIALVLLFAVFPDVLDGRNDKPVAAADRDDRDDDDRDDDDRDDTEEAEADGGEDIFDLQPAGTAEAEPVEAVPEGEIPENMVFPFGTTVGVLLPSYESYEVEQQYITTLSERGAEIVMMRPESDQNAEMAMMQTLIAQGVDVIIAIPVTGVPLEGIAMAQEAGIPVVTGRYDTEEAINTVQLDYEALGEMAVSTYAGEKILVIGGATQIPYTTRIMAGVEEAMGKRSDSEVFDMQYSDFNSENAMTIVNTSLTAYPDIDTVICLDFVSTQSIYDLLESSGFSGTFIALSGDTMYESYNVFGGTTSSVMMYFDTSECISRCADMAAYLLKYGDSGNETIYIAPSVMTEESF